MVLNCSKEMSRLLHVYGYRNLLKHARNGWCINGCTATLQSLRQMSHNVKERHEDYINRLKWVDEPRVKSSVSEEPRLPKRKVALFIGFNGTGYQGMQFNPGNTSIEMDLFNALCKAGAVSKLNSVDPKKVQLRRAARTDKGVHAAGNLVSLKMIIEDPDIVAKVNSYLPEQIRVWGYVPVTKSFEAKRSCDSRIYEYLLPTYTLLPPSPPKPTKQTPDSERDLPLTNPFDPRTSLYISRSTPDELAKKYAFRIDSATYERFCEAVQLFRGTHNFHNYTVRRDYEDPSCKRYIMNTDVSKPMHVDGVEWLSVKIHGQSFMLHQIRKMMSMAMLVTRSNTPLSIIPKSFGPTRILIPKAPAAGLLLQKPVFGRYNREISGRPDREPIDFDKYSDTIEDFKNRWIYPKIFELDRTEQTFDNFMLRVDSQVSPVFSYLNPDGDIPVEAVLTNKYDM